MNSRNVLDPILFQKNMCTPFHHTESKRHEKLHLMSNTPLLYNDWFALMGLFKTMVLAKEDSS